MNNGKTWMYRRLENGFLTNEYCLGVEGFVAFALSHPDCLLNGKLRCPCNHNKCQNKRYLDEDTVKVHLGRYGFVPNYDCWHFHGEQYVRPFFKNVNMDVPTSSYRRPTVDYAPQTYPTSNPVFFENTGQENVNYEYNAENEYHGEENPSTNPVNDSPESSEPAGLGTGTSKHIAGSKTYSAHYHSMRATQGTDPSLWDLYLHTHRRPDESFVDERSRLVHQSMEALRDVSVTPLDDGTIPDQPSSEKVTSMFKNVVGGRKKGRMYGCGSMASTFYPEEMAPRPRGGRSSSSHETQSLREEVEQQKRVIEYLRVDMQASQRREDEMRSRMSFMEDQIRLLVSGMPQVPPTHPHIQSHGRGTFSRGRSRPLTAGTSREAPFTASSSRPNVRGKVLRLASSYRGSPPHRFSQQWVDPSQDFGGGDDDDGDDGAYYDDDKTHAP